jgi:hypothetical protein
VKRYEIVPVIGSGVAGDPIRPNATGSWVTVGQVGNRALIKRPLLDGTAATAGTVADLDDSNPDAPATDVTATPLSAAQKTAIKTFLTNNGIDASQFDADGVSDRRQLLRFLLRRWLGWRAQDFPAAIGGYDVAG